MKKAGLLCIQCLQGEEKQEYYGSISVLLCSKVAEYQKILLNRNCYIKNLDCRKWLGSQPFHCQAATNHYLVHMIIFTEHKTFCNIFNVKEFSLNCKNWMMFLLLTKAHNWCFWWRLQLWLFLRTCWNLDYRAKRQFFLENMSITKIIALQRAFLLCIRDICQIFQEAGNTETHKISSHILSLRWRGQITQNGASLPHF